MERSHNRDSIVVKDGECQAVLGLRRHYQRLCHFCLLTNHVQAPSDEKIHVCKVID
jgi:hypothetical protein